MAAREQSLETRSWRGSESGSAAIEFALSLPLLIILLTGIAELGLGMYEAMQVNNAVDAGALYAAKNGWNSASIAAAVVGASALPAKLNTLTATPAPTEFCGCPSAAGGVTSVGVTLPCSTTACAGATPAGVYVKVNATLTHSALFLTSYFPSAFTASAVIRIN